MLGVNVPVETDDDEDLGQPMFQGAADGAAPPQPEGGEAAAIGAVHLIDVKLVNRPSSFDGTEARWSNWRFVFESYLC